MVSKILPHVDVEWLYMQCVIEIHYMTNEAKLLLQNHLLRCNNFKFKIFLS